MIILTWASIVDTFYPYLTGKSIQVAKKYPAELK
jgi:hypothetical protein